MKRLWACLIIVLMILTLLAGCNTSDNNADSDSHESKSTDEQNVTDSQNDTEGKKETLESKEDDPNPAGLDFYPLSDGTYGVKAGKSIYLDTINIPNKFNEKNITKILSGAFENVTNLKQITLPDTITEIQDNAFSGCTNLNSITIPNSITSISDTAFTDCDSLIITYNGTRSQWESIATTINVYVVFNYEHTCKPVVWTKTPTTHLKAHSDCCGKIEIAEEVHEWNNGVCTECGYFCVCYNDESKRDWENTEITHTKKCNICGSISVATESHKWSEGVCTECGYICLHNGDNTLCTKCGEEYKTIVLNEKFEDYENENTVVIAYGVFHSYQQTHKGIVVPAWGAIAMPPNQTENIVVDFHNPEANAGKYYLTFKLYINKADGSEDVLYESQLIPPGQHIQRITLNHALEKGEYDATIHIQPYKMDGTLSSGFVNFDVKLNLIVK